MVPSFICSLWIKYLLWQRKVGNNSWAQRSGPWSGGQLSSKTCSTVCLVYEAEHIQQKGLGLHCMLWAGVPLWKIRYTSFCKKGKLGAGNFSTDHVIRQCLVKSRNCQTGNGLLLSPPLASVELPSGFLLHLTPANSSWRPQCFTDYRESR